MVSTQADTCPHCGDPEPWNHPVTFGDRAKEAMAALRLGLVLLLLFIAFLFVTYMWSEWSS